ncbi:hypothetical protein OOZ15_13725 [Galbibacter sp. EGI 63066]|uniref:hypothetical protein n=1 Tax=Galbibacter sp. EGI 63066 TaxID=2993559 RepID=UPI002248F8FC|nr:hypothetical protein [Galbibacter sp. EGI 63066]MCX2681008.1 hypothetical protein [Galbibacter sp. EGI 63066]
MVLHQASGDQGHTGNGIKSEVRTALCRSLNGRPGSPKPTLVPEYNEEKTGENLWTGN